MAESPGNAFFVDAAGNISRSLSCAWCGTELCGAPSNGRCARCAWSIEWTVQEAAQLAGIDRDGFLQAGQVCVECDYDLRGVHFDQACPECGVPARESALSHSGRFGDLEWIRAISWGAGATRTGLLCFVAGVLLLCGKELGLLFFATGQIATSLGVWHLAATPKGRGRRHDWLLRESLKWSWATSCAAPWLLVPMGPGLSSFAAIVAVWHLSVLFLILLSRSLERIVARQQPLPGWRDQSVLLSAWAMCGVFGVVTFTAVPPGGWPDAAFAAFLIFVGFVIAAGWLIAGLIARLNLIEKSCARVTRRSSPAIGGPPTRAAPEAAETPEDAVS